jgi:predicted alpha/beta superfamily hydrolase
MKKLKKHLFVALLLFVSAVSFAQYKVTFLVKQPSLLHSMDHLYIAGNFNVWNPGDKSSELYAGQNGILSVTLSLPAGNYEYKFTRGNWEKAETDSTGNGIQNRTLKLESDTTIHINILGWNDDFKQNAATSKTNSTASVNVKIMDTTFYMPQLKRTRRIWLYLPRDYAKSKKKYPVLYMHDGQNLFEAKTSYSGEWGVDEYLDSIFKKGQKEVIVVGIDNGNFKRMQEYNPWEFQTFGKGEGIFSPAFWTASGIDSMVIAGAKNVKSKLFFYAGGKEGDSMIPDMKRIEKEIKERSASPVEEKIDENAKHNEAAWRKYFPDFYEWTVE